ncbi:MAG: hypothetical protein ACT4PE_01780 [Candidatus Eiseniibacteriota bacterium]
MRQIGVAAAILLAAWTSAHSPDAHSVAADFAPEGGARFVCYHGLSLWLAYQTLLGYSTNVDFFFQEPDCTVP